MFAVTDAAKAYLEQRLVEIWAPADGVVRFSIEDDTVAMEPGIAGASDTRFDHNGRTVLVLDSYASDRLKDKVLDYVVSENGGSLVFGEQAACDLVARQVSSPHPLQLPHEEEREGQR